MKLFSSLFLLLLSSCVTSRANMLTLPFGVCTDKNVSLDEYPLDLLKKVDGSKINKIIVFGDSLSDTHNIYQSTAAIALPPCNYWRGRFSNGPNWVDYVSKSQGWSFENYASGGARLYQSSFFRPPLVMQLKYAKKDLGRANPTHTLLVIWFGANDYLNVEKNLRNDDGTINKTNGDNKATNNIDIIRDHILYLRRHGYENVMLGTIPRLSNIPSTQSKQNRKEILDYTVQKHNELLKELAVKENLLIFDAYKINEMTNSDLKGYGFIAADHCYHGGVAGLAKGKNSICSDPLRTKFWDDLHPNTKMHCYYAAEMLADLEKKEVDQKELEKCKNLKKIY